MTKTNRKLQFFFGIVLFILGAALGFWLLGSSTWGDLEANLFDSALSSEEPLRTLDCPVLITTGEVGTISARIENQTDFERKVIVRARFSLGHQYLVEENRDVIIIPAGRRQSLEWEIIPSQAAFDRLVLVRVYQFGSFSIPSRTASCGVMVLNLPQFSGQQIFFAALVGVFLFCTAGLALLSRKSLNPSSRQKKFTNGMLFLGTEIFAGILLSLLGNWLLSTLMVIFAAMIIIGIISFLATSR